MVAVNYTTAVTARVPAQWERRVQTFSRPFQDAAPRPTTPVISCQSMLHSTSLLTMILLFVKFDGFHYVFSLC